MAGAERNWDILIVGGASGSGKTCLCRPLAQFYAVDLVRVDDFQCLLEAIITPEMIPTLHYWKIEPNWRTQSVEWVVDRLNGVSFAREGKEQAHRADISHAWGNLLKEKCQTYNIPVVESRPWSNLMERVILGG